MLNRISYHSDKTVFCGRHLGAFLILLTVYAAGIKAQSRPYTPGVTADGVTYSLPLTRLHFHAEAIRTCYVPGEFARYAERYLHATGIKTESETRFQLQRVSLTTEGEPDTSKVFTIAFSTKSIAPLVTLSAEGVILSINQPATTSAAVATPTSSFRSTNALDAKPFLSEDILMAASTAKMAELTAARIYELRESRNALLNGEADNQPADGEALRLRLEGLQRQEAALTQMFVGYTDTIAVSNDYTVVPHGDMKQVLFRFSHKLGFVDADDLAGEPYELQLSDLKTVILPSEKDLQKRKISGVVYNLPSMAQVTLSDARSVILTTKVPIAQFGTIDQLSADLFKKGATTRISFDSASGALLHIEH